MFQVAKFNWEVQIEKSQGCNFQQVKFFWGGGGSGAKYCNMDPRGRARYVKSFWVIGKL